LFFNSLIGRAALLTNFYANFHPSQPDYFALTTGQVFYTKEGPIPPGTNHITVGAGAGPCAILMVGARLAEEQLHYPVSELAARYGASAEAETTDFMDVYPRFGESRPGRPS